MPIEEMIHRYNKFDGKAYLEFWRRDDGYFEFRSYEWHEGDQYEGEYFAPAYESGIHETLEAAMMEARNVVHWLKEE